MNRVIAGLFLAAAVLAAGPAGADGIDVPRKVRRCARHDPRPHVCCRDRGSRWSFARVVPTGSDVAARVRRTLRIPDNRG
jgi:hypothetical protein